MSKFPEDHHISVVRGKKKPSRKQVKKELIMRIGWLTRKIERCEASLTPDVNPFAREILCLAMVHDMLEEHCDD